MRGRKKVVLLLFSGVLWLAGCGRSSSASGQMPDTAAETNLESGKGTNPKPGGEAKPEPGEEVNPKPGEGANPKPGGEANLEPRGEANLELGEKTSPESGSGTGRTGGETALVHESSMQLLYAENFTVDYYEGGYTLLTTKMDGAQFFIVPEGKEIPQDVDKAIGNMQANHNGIVVLQRPIKDIYLVASSAMDMFNGLDGLDAITFSGQKEDGWFIDDAREAMEQGDILYAGKYNMPDYELIVSNHCSLAIENRMVFHTPEVIEKLEEFGIPVMVESSSYEPHPLGRVEWVKFYGALLGKEEEAEKIFAKQAAILERIHTDEKTGRTVAFFFITSNGLVQVRQSSDYIPKMIGLAGGDYVFDNLGQPQKKRSTVNIQVEEFYAAAKDADYLIYNSSIDGGVSDMGELLDKCGLLADFKAVKKGDVWCTTNDVYQQPLSIGYLMEDIYAMIHGEKGNMNYLFHLE